MKDQTVWNGGAQLGEGRCGTRPRACSGSSTSRPIDPPPRSRDGAVESWAAPVPVGWVLPVSGGGLIAGLQTGLALFDPASGGFDHLVDVEPETPGNRLNDATVAPDGTVWFGSMDDGKRHTTGRFYRWNGHAVAQTPIAAVPTINGRGVSPDGRSCTMSTRPAASSTQLGSDRTG